MQYSENIKAPHFKTMKNIVFEKSFHLQQWDWNIRAKKHYQNLQVF